MDHLELRQEASRLGRLAATCSDPKVREELETLAKDHLARAVAAEQQHTPFPSLARFGIRVAAVVVLVVGGGLALAEWYKPQPREIVVTVQPGVHTAAPGQPATVAKPRPTPSQGGHDVANAEHQHLMTLLENAPLPH